MLQQPDFRVPFQQFQVWAENMEDKAQPNEEGIYL